MVTANRKHLMKRSISCFNNQSYANKELVIVDDGEQDLSEALDAVPPGQLKYLKLEPSDDNTLGKLRNISLEQATGQYLVQWDDDDWYHPDRILIQSDYLDKGYDACCLSGALMHLDTPEYLHHPYVGKLPEGIPGSIMHRNDSSVRYPHTRRAEDTVFLKEWMDRKYIQLPDRYSHLFIRCYHGSNTWEKDHFLRRIRNSPIDLLAYIWHKFIRGNLFSHPKFQLSEQEKEAFAMYLEESQKLGLVQSA
ncbi:glycosyltransferase family A protein [Halalkalibaculum sp. DA3122]|uniref:glycosyltransferase family A protein n=1 Tax=unclassified Halalkalibaculum TaxID=2964617 RepID=UPI003754721A